MDEKTTHNGELETDIPIIPHRRSKRWRKKS